MTISYTPAVLVTGKDEKGNEFSYTRINGVWVDLYRECPVGNSFIATFILPNVVRVKFGRESMDRAEWEASGCPFSLSDEEIAGLMAFHAEPETKPVIRLDMGFRTLRTMDDLPVGDQADAAYGQMDLSEGSAPSWWNSITEEPF